MSIRILISLASCVTAASVVSAQNLTLELVTDDVTSPVFITAPADDFDRLFLVERGGIDGSAPEIKVIRNGEMLAAPFLDLTGSVASGSEMGLLGLAFHPDYAQNGRFFVNYVDLQQVTQVEEYVVSADPDVADPTPVQTIFSQPQPQTHHNGGGLQFGRDGRLYIGLGDGGDPLTSQNGLTNLGKMIRLDVDLPAPFIPPDNPFVGDPGVNDEIWAFGLRNAWRFSFDRLTGDLWIGDVGPAIEEIDFQPADSPGGENYGWSCMAGTDCTAGTSCTCGDPSLTAPIYEYAHFGAAAAVIGGHVYRGSLLPDLVGTYVYADLLTGVYSFRRVDGRVTEFTDRTDELRPSGVPNPVIYSMGEDAAGELYLIYPYAGVFRIVEDCGTDPYCEAGPNSVGPGAQIGNSGTTSIGANSFRVHAGPAPVGEFGLFVYGPEATMTPFGAGFRCVGPGSIGVFRVEPPVAVGADGVARSPVDFTRPPADSGPGAIEAGSVWYFQFWYRDPVAGDPGFNLSNGLKVAFCP